MPKQVKIGVIGCLGRMGQAIVAVAQSRPGVLVVAGCERQGHPGVGSLLNDTGIQVSDSVEAVMKASDVVIDFTPPGNTKDHAALAVSNAAALVVGTTGLDALAHSALDRAAASVAVCQAGNFSLGVNLLAALARQAAAALPAEDWDIEILEMHHRHKVDAPSGTAEMLGEATAVGRGVVLGDKAVRARDGITGPREKGTIGFSVLRGGSVVGEHDVIFASDSERLTLSHHAENRDLFAGGAVTAARWLAGREAGRYTMVDVLGFNTSDSNTSGSPV